ncbi:roadblock/LC7 domain-containing protein [Streptomyces recifensis]|uniref:roadblock/LC7 domain-containing protein n=1 Tax=Streptomyces recifensis TaxID=67355 RepID=UPI000A3D2AB0|nr:roadblock/LC7 domain-containing protein [Streptomyces recifensis]
MRRLFPVTDETAARTARQEGAEPDGAGEWSLAELAAAYAYPASDDGGPRTWLRANMVSTLDGAAQHDGRSQPISCAADMRIFGTLRALADVVLVGAETVRQEGYRPARARTEFAAAREAAGQGPAPAVAVVSGSLDLDFSLPLYTSPLVPTVVLTGADAPADRVAAACAGVQSLAGAVAQELPGSSGEMKLVVIEIDGGYFYLMAAGDNAYLAVLADVVCEPGRMGGMMRDLVVRIGAHLTSPPRRGGQAV